MSTLALSGGGDAHRGGSMAVAALRYADLLVLALALPAFVVSDWPLAGYAVLAGAWVAQRAVSVIARRRAERALGKGDRRSALATVGWTSLGRAWFIGVVVLATGLVDRESGLAAAILAAVLFTVYLAGEAITRRKAS